MTGLLKATNDELQRSRMAHELAIASAQAKEMINTCDNSEDKRVFQQALVTSQLQRYIALNQLNTHKKVDEDKGEETLKIAGAGSGLLSMHDMLPNKGDATTPAGSNLLSYNQASSSSSRVRTRDEEDDKRKKKKEKRKAKKEKKRKRKQEKRARKKAKKQEKKKKVETEKSSSSKSDSSSSSSSSSSDSSSDEEDV